MLRVEHLLVHGRVAAVVFVRPDRHLVVHAEGEKQLGLAEHFSQCFLRNTVVFHIEETEVSACLLIHPKATQEVRGEEA